MTPADRDLARQSHMIALGLNGASDRAAAAGLLLDAGLILGARQTIRVLSERLWGAEAEQGAQAPSPAVPPPSEEEAS